MPACGASCQLLCWGARPVIEGFRVTRPSRRPNCSAKPGAIFCARPARAPLLMWRHFLAPRVMGRRLCSSCPGSNRSAHRQAEELVIGCESHAWFGTWFSAAPAVFGNRLFQTSLSLKLKVVVASEAPHSLGISESRTSQEVQCVQLFVLSKLNSRTVYPDQRRCVR